MVGHGKSNGFVLGVVLNLLGMVTYQLSSIPPFPIKDESSIIRISREPRTNKRMNQSEVDCPVSGPTIHIRQFVDNMLIVRELAIDLSFRCYPFTEKPALIPYPT